MYQRIVNKAKRTLRAVTAKVRAEIAPHVDVDVGSYKIAVDLRDPYVGNHIYLERQYDAHIWSWLRRLDLKGKVCLDLGANVGAYSILFSELVGAQGKVIAFEPEPKNFRLLCRSRDLNRAENLVCVEKAVAAENGACTLSVNPFNWSDHWVLGVTPAPSWATVLQVEQVSVDAFLEPSDDARIGVVKIDVQGNEFSVLQGMRRTIKNNPHLVLVIEVSPTHLRNTGSSATAVMDFLKSEGFVGWDVEHNRISPVGPSWAYELMTENYWADVIVSRDLDLLRTMFVPQYGPLAVLSPSPAT
jgi:FkbM family methyltransferase